ncbi:MAG: neutral/alkaline non-lysosomal ceramidase N-terminal domain-containing protein [Bacteroidales bacterium]|nr:neutral/alkaline non-lysosomal ceramidase N-terminal domain-containing protein [Bacteroidales bacterium]
MKIRSILLFVLALSVFFIAAGQSDKQSLKTGVLRAGIAKADITPDIPVMLYGYASRKTPSEGIHDHLYARAVAFENGGKKIVMVSTDLGSYTDTLYSVIKKSVMEKFGLKDSEFFLAAIHSHSSPVISLDVNKLHINNVQYTRVLQQKILTVVGDALKNLRPVNTGAGKGYSPVGSNRRETTSDGSVTLGRNPYGVTDKEVLVFKITDTDGKPVGAIFDYATHATSLGPDNMMISGDVLGISEQFVEQILGKDFVSPVFAGASGNIDPWYRILPSFNTENGWIPETVLLGTLLGEEVVHVFMDIKNTLPGGEISSSFEIIQCPRKSLDEKDEELPALDQQKTVPVTITAAHIGNDVAFISFNVEMLTEIGMAIKAGSPFKNTFIITHCNGSSGYLPPAALYKEGGYEINSTHFAIGADDIVIKKALRMLYDLK